ncbi:MAG: flagellar protein FlaG [Deltaproteobacteria bacterium]|nr:flagellar protein FlaG [Myxococcales bacterium]MDP3218791.1 flagellar protein FlaG [Deltaproteobacteria bacterium]
MTISPLTSIASEGATLNNREPAVRAEVPGSATNKTQEAKAPQTRPAEEARRAEEKADTPVRELSEMLEIVEAANEKLKSSNAVISFSVDPDTRIVVTTLLDSRTNEVIRQIPNEAVLEIARSLDKIAPILVQEKV